MKIAFISCVSKKLDRPAKAKDLYISDLFKKSYTYTKKHFDQVYILSALYGLVHPDDIIEPYNKTLNKMKVAERKEWSFNVMRDLIKIITDNDELYFFCGKNYRRFLVDWLPNKIHIPLKGLGIGKQLQWYKKQLLQEERI